jgi:hypothetical protein
LLKQGTEQADPWFDDFDPVFVWIASLDDIVIFWFLFGPDLADNLFIYYHFSFSIITKS